MNRGTPDKKQRKSTDIRQREIVDAAIQIIAEEGSRLFTAKNLAGKVGITSGAIFRHFATMDAVVEAVVDHMEAVLFQGFPPQDADPIRRLEAFFRDRTGAIIKFPHVSRLLLSDHLKQTANPEQARRVEQFKARTREFVMGCLKGAHQQGMLVDAGAEEAAVLVMGAVFALGHARLRADSEQKLHKQSEKVWALLERMFRPGEIPQ